MVASGMALKYMASGGPRPEADLGANNHAMLLLDFIGSSIIMVGVRRDFAPNDAAARGFSAVN